METEQHQTILDIRSLSSCDLVSILKLEGEEGIKRLAFSEFHKRFKNRFYRKCLTACIDGGFGKNLAEDIFQEAFIKLIKNIKNFSIDETLPLKRVDNKIVAWFGKIANNEFINYIRKYKSGEQITEEYEELVSGYCADFVDEIETDENISEVRIKLREALATLSERERYILLISAENGCIGNTKHLPEDALEDICKNFGITKNYSKQLRFRAYNKIKDLLSG